MGYSIYRCEECGKFLLSDGGSFLAHKKVRHNKLGYGGSKVVALIESRERKYEFRDTPQEQREEWIKNNGMRAREPPEFRLHSPPSPARQKTSLKEWNGERQLFSRLII